MNCGEIFCSFGKGDWIKCSRKSLRREVNTVTTVVLLNERKNVIISEVQELSRTSVRTGRCRRIFVVVGA